MAEYRPGYSASNDGVAHDGVVFFEGVVDRPVVIRIRVEISRQNSNLSEVKSAMAARAKAVGSDTICGFRYGQVAHSWWKQLFTFAWDSESWFGEGDAVRAAPASTDTR